MDLARALRPPAVGALVTALTVAGAVVGLTTTSATAAPARPYQLTSGHIDLFEVTYDEGTDQLDLQVKDDTNLYGTGVAFREPEDVTVSVDEELAAESIPADPAYAFLGTPGDPMYLLPQVQDPALPWPGWSTERLSTTPAPGIELSGSQPVQLSVSVSGPGDVFTWQNGTFGSPTNRYIDTTDGGPDTIPIAVPAHVHTNWAFTELGSYTLTVTPRATTTTGVLTGPPSSYHFQVGEAAPEIEVTADREGAQYLYGQGITLNAAPTQPTDLDHYHWFIKREGDTDFQISDRSATAELKLPTSLVWDDAQVYARLYDADHEVVATSETITLDVTALEPITTLVATADKASHRVGDVAQLTSSQDPATAEDHYHWYLKKPGEEFYTYIPGSDAAEAELTIAADMDGASVVARLFNDDHAVVAESAPIELDVKDGAWATTTTLALDQASQVYGDAPARATAQVVSEDDGAMPGTVEIAVDGEPVASGLTPDSSGEVSVDLPAALEPGEHSVTAAFSPEDPALHAPSSSEPVMVRVRRAPTTTAADLARMKIPAGRNGVVKVHVTSTVAPSGKVVVRSGKRVLTRRPLNENGRARIVLPKLRTGKHRLVVAYPGNDLHTRSTDAVTLRVRRR